MSEIITYSPAYTLVPTYECFNRCSYCNFRAEPGTSPWLTLEEAEKKLLPLKAQGVIEILILSGEVHPSASKRKAWFKLIYDLCELALTMGFLPHTNAGPLTLHEMECLKDVNVSMGLMLEQLTPQLLETVHKYAPSKVPSFRVTQLEWAGQLKIPFTTGLLLGIGEEKEDWEESLESIAHLHQKHSHIQEVILQPHSRGEQQNWQVKSFLLGKMPEVIRLARSILPSDITLQIPPNLVKTPDILLECFDAGARDLGGICPRDEVNPNYPHPPEQELTELLKKSGYQWEKRLPVYPQYYHWLSPRLQHAIQSFQVVHDLSVK
jgi:7,8-didemethyl-8-hydroxy-5-deazariboflavin synthase